MDEQELVRIDLRLPASALESLSRLAEQLRLLTDTVNDRAERSAPPAQEHGENTFFDAERSQSLQTGPVLPVRAPVTEDVPSPESAGREVAEYQEGSARADPPDGGGIPDAETAAADIRDVHPAQAVRRDLEEDLGEIPTVRPEMGRDMPDAPAAGPEPEARVPEADTEDVEKIRMSAWDVPLPAAQGDVSSGIESPLGAGMVVTAEPDIPQSRWTGITEELVTSGPAPLTAEAVSLAFQRDGRRYDNGFPLY